MQKNPKQVPVNKRFRVEFKTDAADDYLTRPNNRGEFTLRVNGKKVDNYSLHPCKGIVSINVVLPAGVKVGEQLVYSYKVEDIHNIKPFEGTFNVVVKKAAKKTSGPPAPPGDHSGKSDQGKGGVALPEVHEVYQEEWNQHDHNFNDRSALRVIHDDGEWTFFVNMDNRFLHAEIKEGHVDAELIKSQFKYSLALIGMALIDEEKKAEEHRKKTHAIEDGDKDTIHDKVRSFTSSVASVLLPMIHIMGSLSIETDEQERD